MSWQSTHLRPSTERRLQRAGELISGRLAHPEQVSGATGPPLPDAPATWDGPTLANGHAGIALLHATSATAPRWDVDGAAAWATDHMLAAVRLTQVQPLQTTDLFSGSAGLAFALQACAEVEPRFSRVLAGVVPTTLAEAREEYADAPVSGTAPQDYDVISGPAGLLGWIDALPQEYAASAAPLRDHLHTGLGRLFRHGATASAAPPWRILPELVPVEERLELAPAGYSDTGLAHGAAGPLAALSLWDRGDKDVMRSIQDIVAWLLRTRTQDDAGPNWPTLIPTGTALPAAGSWAHSRTAWCYGAPGVVAALSLAHRRAPSAELADAIGEATEAMMARIGAGRAFSTPTLCHGSAGVAVILRHLADDHGNERAGGGLEGVAEQLLATVDPSAEFGVQDIEPGPKAVDNPTLLNGAAGVALALHALLSPGRPTWTRLLMIG
ncbi:lanthionine synthetase C family protein [Clavibacter sp. CFBP 8614]|uniref:lanthionine synthetase C family protein n=1 Tax=unclassified Clavibacter TaxID=2626594 RepID=UPI004043680B